MLSARGVPAGLLTRWLNGEFELVVSPLLLDELEWALLYPKLRSRIDEADAAAYVALLRDSAVAVPDPDRGSHRSSDPGDDYLLVLAEAARAVLVTGDGDLLALGDDLPVVTARAFLDLLPA